jgi:uncharacterized membrane protein
MVLKIFKAVWFLSVLVTLFNLLYVFAALPEVVILQESGPEQVSTGRDEFFYAAMAVIALVNAMVYAVSYVYRGNIDLRTWFHGLVITLNIFFIIALNFISLFNSGEKFDYGKIDFIIYGSILLFVGWAMGWPLYGVYQKITAKQPV